MSIETKFKDMNSFEPIADIYLFFPIAKSFVPIFKKLGLTPNMITSLSLIFTFNSFLKIKKNKIILNQTIYTFL